MSFAERRPATYRLVVLLFGSLGYIYLAGTAVVIVATTTGLAFLLVDMGVGPPLLRVSLPFLLLVLLLISAFRAPDWPTRGLFLARREALPLHALVESVRRRVRAPDVRSVHIDAGFGVTVVRMPRLGSLLGFHTHLVLGLPLMLALPLHHFRALLAHELAHYSRAGRPEGILTYRLRDRWLQLSQALTAARHPATVLMRAFFRWYAPRFAALSYACARRHELAADRLAAAATSRDDLAHALIRRGVIEQFLEARFYPQLLADVRDLGVPPSGLQARFARGIRGVMADRRFAAWLAESRSRDAHLDTHPSVADRLAALGLTEGWSSGSRTHDVAAFAPMLDGESAARHCLGSVRSELLLSIEHAWIEDVMQLLSDRHEELKRWDERRRELGARQDLSPGETLELAISTSAIEGTDTALPILHSLVVRRPDMAPARFMLGTLLLRRNDADGLEHLRVALTVDPELTPDGCRFVREFLAVNGGPVEAVAFLDRFEPDPEANPVGDAGDGAMSRVCDSEPAPPGSGREKESRPDEDGASLDSGCSARTASEPGEDHRDGSGAGYSRHGLDYAETLTVRRGIAPVAAVARAFLVRETAVSRPLPAGALTVPIRRAGGEAAGQGSRFLLAVELMRGDHDPSAVATRLAAEVSLPGPGVIVVLSRRHRRLRRAVTVAGSPLFERTRRRAA